MKNLWTNVGRSPIRREKNRSMCVPLHKEGSTVNRPGAPLLQLEYAVLCLENTSKFIYVFFPKYEIFPKIQFFPNILNFWKCIFLKCIYPKCIFAKCTRLVCLLSFASFFTFALNFFPDSLPYTSFRWQNDLGKKGNLGSGKMCSLPAAVGPR